MLFVIYSTNVLVLERCDRLFAMVDHRNEYFFDCHGTIVPPVYAALHVGQVESALACEVFLLCDASADAPL